MFYTCHVMFMSYSTHLYVDLLKCFSQTMSMPTCVACMRLVGIVHHIPLALAGTITSL